ncbi:MAG TPA: amidohydrolase family protein, partial [Candidatus Saccharimonadia bacterium]|nr:amidohydrolase family protein [Candidatus Saccharimonadia bacterium]
PEKNCLSREEALRLYTQGSSWFSTEAGKKGGLAKGQLADLAVLTEDYFNVPDEAIKSIESMMTVVGGKVVHGTGDLSSHGPAPLPVLPEWSPLTVFGGYGAPLDVKKAALAGVPLPEGSSAFATGRRGSRVVATDAAPGPFDSFWGNGCDCFAF